MKRKVIITGGGGYLGGVVAPWLNEHGFDVTIFDTGFFKESLLYPETPCLTVYKDARDFSDSDLEGAYALVHFAGISNDPFGNLPVERIYDPTRVYAKKIAELCKRKGVRFIFASSCSVYGKAEGEMLDETSVVNPQTGYSKNKLDIERDLATLADETFSPIALRFATAFGLAPRIRFDIVINMLVGMAIAEKKITLNSDGQAWRPNVHVEDIARSIAVALETPWNRGELCVVNVGRQDNNMKIVDIAKIVSEECDGAPITFLGKDGAPSDALVQTKLVAIGGADTRNYQVSFDKLGKVFPGFSCTYSVRQGVREMAQKFKTLALGTREFKNPKFYRLQTIERLLAEGKIDENLRWTKQA